MLKYIRRPNADRSGDDFGIGYEDFRYSFSGLDSDIEALAKRLCSCYGPGDCEGTEFQEIIMKNGTVTKYAEFELK